MTLDQFKTGDLLLLTQRYKRGNETMVEVRSAQVTSVNYNENGMVSYAGFSRVRHLETGQGAFYPAEIGTTQFGFACKVEIVGHQKYPNHHPAGPRPGDTAFDLMC